MCMLTYIPAGVEHNPDELFNGALKNDDGHGWAVITGNRITRGRSMRFEEALEGFEKVRANHPEGPALFHSRWATHGTMGVANVHPFKVGNDRRTVLAHNGVLPAKAHPLKGDERSDTRKFAQSILPHWGHLDKARTIKSLSDWLGGNKILILTVNPMYRSNVYLLGEKHGDWTAEGIWYSNSDYKPWAPNRHTYSWENDEWWRGWSAPSAASTAPRKYSTDSKDDCPFCGAIGFVNLAWNICKMCETCLDCGSDLSRCDCSVPEYMKGAPIGTWPDEKDRRDNVVNLPVRYDAGGWAL